MTSIGPYVIERELGRGGMARVYQARHAATGAVRALKVFGAVLDPEAVARFRREAEALARVSDRNVVAIHESGLEKGQLWFVMDLMSGGTLRAVLERRGALPVAEAVALVAEVARALARCHELGLVHRDVKPENILLDDRGAPRLSDFGLARDLGASRLTETGTVLGTPGYMPPEQLDGRPCGPPADVFALGVVLYELVAGVRPFEGRSLVEHYDAATKRRYRPLGEVAKLPPGLETVVARALSPVAADRFADGAALAAALEPRAARPAVPRRGPHATLLALLALVALLGLSGVVLQVRAARGIPATVPTPPTATSAPRASYAELRRRLRPGARLESAELAGLEAALRSDEDREDLLRLLESPGLRPECSMDPLGALASAGGSPRSAAVARALSDLALLHAALATEDGRAALVSGVACLPPPGSTEFARDYVKLELDSRSEDLRVAWERTMTGTLRGPLARSAAAMTRRLHGPFAVLARAGVRASMLRDSRAVAEYIFLEQLRFATAQYVDDLRDDLLAPIAFDVFLARNNLTRPSREELRWAFPRLNGIGERWRKNDPVFAAALIAASASDPDQIPARQDRRKAAIAILRAASVAPDDEEWRHFIVADNCAWLAADSNHADWALDTLAEGLHHARFLVKSAKTVSAVANVGRELIRRERLDEIDRWLPEDGVGEARMERACVVACSFAASDIEEARRRLREAVEGGPTRTLLAESRSLVEEARAFIERAR